MSFVEAPESLASIQSATPFLREPNNARLSSEDAEELRARRAADVKLAARLHGWKPIVLWYSLWTVIIGIGAISSLAAGQMGASMVSIGISALCAKYAHYLYNGGRRRVWFVIW